MNGALQHYTLLTQASFRSCFESQRANRTEIFALLGLISSESCMSGKQSSGKAKSSDVQKRDEANLGQKEARLEKKKASELTSMGEKSQKPGQKPKEQTQ